MASHNPVYVPASAKPGHLGGGVAACLNQTGQSSLGVGVIGKSIPSVNSVGAPPMKKNIL